MKKLKIVPFIFLFVGAGFVSAETVGAPMPPQPECRVTAEVVETDVTHSPWSDFAKEEGVATEETPGWTVIEILQTEEDPVVSSDFTSEDYCIEQYYEGREIILKIDEDYAEGAVIQGSLSVGGDEFGVWYNLREVTVISIPEGDPVTPHSWCRVTAEVVESDVAKNDSDRLAEAAPPESTTIVIRIIEVEKEPIYGPHLVSEDYCIEQYYKGREIRLITHEESYAKGSIIEGVLTMIRDDWGVWWNGPTVISVPETEEKKNVLVYAVIISVIVIIVTYLLYRSRK